MQHFLSFCLSKPLDVEKLALMRDLDIAFLRKEFCALLQREVINFYLKNVEPDMESPPVQMDCPVCGDMILFSQQVQHLEFLTKICLTDTCIIDELLTYLATLESAPMVED